MEIRIDDNEDSHFGDLMEALNTISSFDTATGFGLSEAVEKAQTHSHHMKPRYCASALVLR